MCVMSINNKWWQYWLNYWPSMFKPYFQWNLCNPTPEYSDILWHDKNFLNFLFIILYTLFNLKFFYFTYRFIYTVKSGPFVFSLLCLDTLYCYLSIYRLNKTINITWNILKFPLICVFIKGVDKSMSSDIDKLVPPIIIYNRKS